MKKLDIVFILGTGRKGRESEKVARFVMDIAQQRPEIAATFVDVRDYATAVTVPPWEKSKQGTWWMKRAAAADGFVIITPEYNHGYPGELKIFLDKAFKEYLHKVVGLCVVSSGGFGGARVYENLLSPLVDYGLTVSKFPVNVSVVEELFADDGTMKPEHVTAYTPRITKLLDDVIWTAAALKAAREHTN